MNSSAAGQPRILVTDFDGTMTRFDFYALVERELLPPDTPDFWSDYRAGRLTHFEALSRYFASIRADEKTVLQLVNRMELDSNLHSAVQALRQNGWQVVIASAGCEWYIRRLLGQAGVHVEIHANPGRFESGRGLIMEANRESPFFSPTHGVDKAAVVRHFRDSGHVVAFAGDGFPDVDASRLVPEKLRFARGDLAAVLRADGQPFQPYQSWSEVARYIGTNQIGAQEQVR